MGVLLVDQEASELASSGLASLMMTSAVGGALGGPVGPFSPALFRIQTGWYVSCRAKLLYDSHLHIASLCVLECLGRRVGRLRPEAVEIAVHRFHRFSGDLSAAGSFDHPDAAFD